MTSSLDPSRRPAILVEQDKNLQEAEEISTLLFQEDGPLQAIAEGLKERGFEYQMLLAVYSADDIRVKYILTNQEATAAAVKEIQAFFFESVSHYGLSASAFTLQIVDEEDGVDW